MQEDDAQHAKICKEFQQGVAYLGWKSERRVGGFGEDVIVEVSFHFRVPLSFLSSMFAFIQSMRIYYSTLHFISSFYDETFQIRPNDPPQHRKKVMEVKAIVDAELGFSSTSVSKTNPLKDMTCYLYISKKRVVGLLLVKQLKRAYELISPDSNQSHDDNIDFNDRSERDNQHRSKTITPQKDSYSRSLKPSKAMMGVHQIWCHRSHRKC
ncbi:hypothetical protein ACHAXS_013169, partial [Conticribra weissflogii]